LLGRRTKAAVVAFLMPPRLVKDHHFWDGQRFQPTREEDCGERPIILHRRYLTRASSHSFTLLPSMNAYMMPPLRPRKAAYAYLRNLIKSLVDGIGKQIFSIQKEECDKQIQRDVTSGEDKELGILRSEFVHHIEDLSREHSRSYVHNSLE
jgi:hypothetical protein